MRVFVALLRVELKKALLGNPWFWGAVGLGSILALFSAAQSFVVFQNTLELAQKYWNQSDALYSAVSCFAFWMPTRPHEFAPGIFIMVWPLLAAAPYAWSWCSERSSGVLAQACARVSRSAYYAAKALAGFVAGALAIVLPLILNLVVCACFAPAAPVWVSDLLYVGVDDAAPLSSLFYNNPLAFCLVWTLVAGAVAGLWATAVGALSMVVRNFLETFVVSYLLLHVLAFVGSQLWMLPLVGSQWELAHSALLTFDVFSVVGVRSDLDAGPALIIVVASLLLFSFMLPSLLLRRDVL